MKRERTMKKYLLVLSVFLVVVACFFTFKAYAGAISDLADKVMGGGDAADEAAGAKKNSRYVVRLKNGGKVETDNYAWEKDTLRINLPSGAISLARSEVLSIKEVEGAEGATVQEIFVAPPREEPVPAPETRPLRPKQAPRPGETGVLQEQTDDNGHTEAWWTARADEWKERLKESEIRYRAAEDDWNRYNGILNTLGGPGFGNATSSRPGVSGFQITQYQDLRGSARVRMDEAQADVAEAKKMLGEVLPDEARRAGAPPGWAR